MLPYTLCKSRKKHYYNIFLPLTTLQESDDCVARMQGSLHRSELATASLSREERRLADRVQELEDRLR